MDITINGVEYYQPNCYCKGGGHICYLRPKPQAVNTTIAKVIKAMGAKPGTLNSSA